MNRDSFKFSLNCPLPISDYKNVLLAHGGGGSLSKSLIEKFFYSQFGNKILLSEGDSAVLNHGSGKIAFTTDSYVVSPIFFPGGNIGELAVNGTVNDLAVSGATPRYLSAAFILEEGFPMDELWEIVLSMKEAAKKAGVTIVTGDTKVVDKGKGDKLFINTAGIGEFKHNVNITPENIKVGDKIIINGNIAEHGIAIMATRENLNFKSEIKSDTAALNGLIGEILDFTTGVHMMRDPTRGGLASSLNEIAKKGGKKISIFEDKIPILPEVSAACELLGLDPLYLANEGKALIFVSDSEADETLKIMRNNPLGINSQIIGEVIEGEPSVVMKTRIGSNRIVDMISGEQLPRIC